ncbi:MAG: hypothetical protein IT567_02575 [Alphaproteobacteria bacterium]|nr:hypothetical protein [Alphaproteobacteria bacterium]
MGNGGDGQPVNPVVDPVTAWETRVDALTELLYAPAAAQLEGHKEARATTINDLGKELGLTPTTADEFGATYNIDELNAALSAKLGKTVDVNSLKHEDLASLGLTEGSNLYDTLENYVDVNAKVTQAVMAEMTAKENLDKALAGDPNLTGVSEEQKTQVSGINNTYDQTIITYYDAQADEAVKDAKNAAKEQAGITYDAETQKLIDEYNTKRPELVEKKAAAEAELEAAKGDRLDDVARIGRLAFVDASGNMLYTQEEIKAKLLNGEITEQQINDGLNNSVGMASGFANLFAQDHRIDITTLTDAELKTMLTDGNVASDLQDKLDAMRASGDPEKIKQADLLEEWLDDVSRANGIVAEKQALVDAAQAEIDKLDTDHQTELDERKNGREQFLKDAASKVDVDAIRQPFEDMIKDLIGRESDEEQKTPNFRYDSPTPEVTPQSNVIDTDVIAAPITINNNTQSQGYGMGGH